MGGGVLWYVLIFKISLLTHFSFFLCCLAFGKIEGEFDE